MSILSLIGLIFRQYTNMTLGIGDNCTPKPMLTDITDTINPYIEPQEICTRFVLYCILFGFYVGQFSVFTLGLQRRHCGSLISLSAGELNL